MSVKIVVSYHSVNNDVAIRLDQYLKSNKYEPYLVSQDVPETLYSRSKALQISNIMLVIASRDYQKSISCMELLNYAKDLKKTIIVLNPNQHFKPFGALGAIAAAGDLSLLEPNDQKSLNNCFEEIGNYLNKQVRPQSSKAKKTDDNLLPNENNEHLEYTGIAYDVLLSFHPESFKIVNMIEEEMKKHEIKYVAESSITGKSSINTSKLLVVIISPSYEANNYSRLIVEEARASNKDMIPVSTEKTYKPEKWLGLVIAGKLYYRLFNKDQAYQKIYDTTPINNFIYAVKVALTDKPTIEKREKAELEVLNKRIAECKQQLKIWPPKRKERTITKREPIKIVLQEPKADLEFNHIHYTVTRMNFNPPQPLFDSFGIPLRRKFDCMISYQWDHQDLVREVYMDLYMKSINAWFDMWGKMEGNSNEAMATAIESSKVILVFLSDSYQKSINCKMEFKYAVSCGKPIIFIMIEPDLKLEDWIKPYLDTTYKYEIFGVKDLGILHNNVPRIDCIAQAMRTIGNAQPDYNDYDLSDEVFDLRQLLNDALDEISLNTGKERFKTCTRCNKQYEENNSIGCKSHSAYYMGGNILAGRWVCCNQQDKNSVGCKDTNHICLARKWTCDPNYGTYTWVPS